jgi:hypothetical protein
VDIALSLKIAAIRSGTEPVRQLPAAAFHRWLETPILCPKCSVSYNMVTDWDAATDRWFTESSRPLIRLLTKAVQMGHSNNHRVTHFETAGVVVESVMSSVS